MHLIADSIWAIAMKGSFPGQGYVGFGGQAAELRRAKDENGGIRQEISPRQVGSEGDLR